MLKPKALYFPHTEIQSPVILKNALLLWDRIETIVPNRQWTPARSLADRSLRRATELVVEPRIPTDEERNQAHDAVEMIARTGAIDALVKQIPASWRRQHYLIYPDKFLNETWDLLEQPGIAWWIHAESDYGVPAAVGLLMMSILADACAGTQLQKVTDRADAYAWIAEHHARIIGSQYVTNLDISQVAPAQDRLVALSLEVLDARRIPLKKLLALREREARSRSSDYTVLRRHYFNTLNAHLNRLGKEARTASDVRELDRQFKEDLEQDLADLKMELGLASLRTLLSNKVALTALVTAGCLIAPVPGLTTLATKIGGLGIIPLLKAAVDYRSARKDILRKHAMSWLYLTQEGPITFR